MVYGYNRAVELTESTKTYNFNELCQITGETDTSIENLIALGIIISDCEDNTFSTKQFEKLQIALRLSRELCLNSQAVALVLELLDRIKSQQIELDLLRFYQATNKNYPSIRDH